MASGGDSPPGSDKPPGPVSDETVSSGLELIGALSDDIGPRPPCSGQEREASLLISRAFTGLGLDPTTEEFASSRSFGPSYLVMFAMALAAAALERRRPVLAALTGAGTACMAAAESRFLDRTPLRLLRRSLSRNVRTEILPRGRVRRTVCLVSHMDSSRSGLMFHPRATPHLAVATAVAGAAMILAGLAPVLRRVPGGKSVVSSARGVIALSALIVLEREISGTDVSGANDNASGVAACLCLAAHFASTPLDGTRVVVLVTGSEESGVFGMREFLAANDTEDWDFINFDGVGADAPLRVLSCEGGLLSGLAADPGLMASAAEVGLRFPSLLAEPLAQGSGLPYDATPVLARGGRAISVVNQDGAIPDYHWPTDTADRVSAKAFARAVQFGARLVRQLDSS